METTELRQASSTTGSAARPGARPSGLAPLRRTLELALTRGVTVSAGAARLPAHRVPPMAPLVLISGGHATFTGVAHRDDLAA